jgi:hypothetical protein
LGYGKQQDFCSVIMAFTLVQRVATQWFLNGTSPSLTVSSTASGNLLVMFVANTNLTGNTFGFPAGWASPIHTSSTHSQTWGSYYLNNPGSITSVQITGVTNTGDTNVVFYEFSTNNGASNVILDNSHVNTGTAVALTSTLSLAQTNDAIMMQGSVELANDTGSPTYDSGFTGHIIGHNNAVGTTYDEYNASSSAASLSITPGVSITGDDWSTVAFAFTDVSANPFPAAFGYPAKTMLRQLLAITRPR